MWRLLRLLIPAALAVALAAWVAAHPGLVELRWQGYLIQTSVGVAAAALLVLVALLIGLAGLWRWLRQAPRRLARGRRERKRLKGTQALIQGFAAIAAQDSAEARRQLRRVQSLAVEPALALQLEAQTAELSGDDDGAFRAYGELKARPASRALALRGLVAISRRRGDGEAARALIGEALAADPKAAWALNDRFALETAAGDWAGAAATLDRLEKLKLVDRERARAWRALVLTEQGRHAQAEGQVFEAERAARAAVAADPAYPPAALLLAEVLVTQDKGRKAQGVLEKAWAAHPHPDLATAYAAQGRDSADPLARVRRVERLVAMHPESGEGHLALAAVALDARLWGEARHHLEAVIAAKPTRRAFRLMAELEEKGRNDAEAAKVWLQRAAVAADDAGWVCETCAAVAETAGARCPVCGRFGTLSWRAPGAILPPRPRAEAAALPHLPG